MLDRARAKAAVERAGAVRPRFEWADAMSLPYDRRDFDAATVGFGARNFDDLARGLAEMARVVRPGGRVVVLEITTPTRAPLSLFYRLWFDRLVPALGRARARRAAARPPRPAAGGIADAYTYLPDSVRRFPAPAELAAEMERAGLARSATPSPPAASSRSTPAPCRWRRVRGTATADGDPQAPSLDGVDAVLRLGGEALGRSMQRTEEHLERVTLEAACRSRATRTRRSAPAASGCARCW